MWWWCPQIACLSCTLLTRTPLCMFGDYLSVQLVVTRCVLRRYVGESCEECTAGWYNHAGRCVPQFIDGKTVFDHMPQTLEGVTAPKRTSKLGMTGTLIHISGHTCAHQGRLLRRVHARNMESYRATQLAVPAHSQGLSPRARYGACDGPRDEPCRHSDWLYEFIAATKATASKLSAQKSWL
jgi:hypothetical protein